MVNERTSPLSGTRVLIVEDEYYLADDLSRSLSQAGAEVVGPVGSIEEADSLVDGGAFDCAVIDMNLRGDFAFALAGRLAAANVPFVVATGFNESLLADALKDVPRVQKPYAASEIIAVLSKLSVPATH